MSRMMSKSQNNLPKIVLLCALSCATWAGCQSANKSSVAVEPGEVSISSNAELIQASYREEGPNGSRPESDYHTTRTGLKYRILREGNGVRPTDYDRVQVSYRGWLDNGTVFDSSYERGKPITFKLRDVVAGWTEGMQHVSEGGKIELQIPSSLGYGSKGSPPSVPPFATLHFIVELHEVF